MNAQLSTFENFISYLYDFSFNELPNFLSYLITPLDELTSFPDWIYPIIPHVSLVDLLFYSLIAVFVVRPAIRFFVDFVSS